MKIRKDLILVFVLGLALGVILASEVMNLASERVCPQKACVGEAEVVPISDRGYFPAVHKALQEAKNSIHIAAFELKYYPNNTGSNENLIVEDIISASRRGLDVRIVVDEYSQANNAYDYLRASGVNIKQDKKDVTTHAKLVVIDGRVVILGSTNFSYFALERNNEVDVLIASEKVAAYFNDYFESLWKQE